MKIAYSPCPNDTFIFYAWAHGLIPGAPELDVVYADIDKTNQWAVQDSGPEVMKISYAALPWALDHYRLLPCGGALGRGCGPLVLTGGAGAEAGVVAGAEAGLGAGARKGQALEGSDGSTALAKEVPWDGSLLSGKRVAVPSERSTAYLLFRLWAAKHVPGGIGEVVVMPFHEIMPAVRDGRIDAGLVIHEARFTYSSYGLKLVADMGSWWEADTGLPIPLGAILARRELDSAAITHWIRASLDYAWANPEAPKEYILAHAQEMDPQVAKAHIELYVNSFSADLGEEGRQAVMTLLNRAAEEGLVPAIDPTRLF